MKRIVILVFEKAELLDFCGPFEIISTLETEDLEPVEVVLWNPLESREIKSANGASVIADEIGELAEDSIDLLVVPGGEGSRTFLRNSLAMGRLSVAFGLSERVLSVCTGARILAAAGVLKGLCATTHSSAQVDLAENYPEVIWDFSKRFHDNGKWIISAGVASGIDAALYWLGNTFGESRRRDVAQAVEVPLVGNMAIFGGLAYQIVDAFCTDKSFSGNPAAVCILDESLPDSILQKIAMQHNLSETAYLNFLEIREDSPVYELRWFTPEVEVDLCGHATLASASVVFDLNAAWEQVIFVTRSGELLVKKGAEGLEMDFPKLKYEAATEADLLGVGLPGEVVEVQTGMDLAVVVNEAQALMDWSPNLSAVEKLPYRGLIVTAKYSENGYDFVSRFFAPQSGVPEDPFTGSAHCWLAPYWCDQLGKGTVTGLQASKRQGRAVCSVVGDRVLLSGAASLYSTGYIAVERLVEDE
ncbi:MAG: PhzF family phenazine biosynthesis isomerase [Opitutales bacterium]